MNTKPSVTSERQEAPESSKDSPWRTFKSGDHVVVETSQNRKVPGLIDAITDDHSVLWVHLGAGQGRRLFHWQEDVTVTHRK